MIDDLRDNARLGRAAARWYNGSALGRSDLRSLVRYWRRLRDRRAAAYYAGLYGALARRADLNHNDDIGGEA